MLTTCNLGVWVGGGGGQLYKEEELLCKEIFTE